MSDLFESLPAEVKTDLDALGACLDIEIPERKSNNILIATWNIRQFGELTEKWKAAPSDSPKRDLHSLLCIIEIIKRFDIIAVQEVKGNIKCLRETMKQLGDDWSFLMTDITAGKPGNDERFAFIFNTKRAKLSGLACEIVIPDEQLKKNITPDALQKQFARTPYAVSFKAGNKTFVLLTLHVLYGKTLKERVPELKGIAEWMYQWAKELNRWGFSLLTLGDFNIDRKGDEAYQAFVSTGLHVPGDLDNLCRTIFGNTSFYDQIAWFNNRSKDQLINLEYLQGGVFNFEGKLLTTSHYTKSQLSFRISDHMPLWAEFGV